MRVRGYRNPSQSCNKRNNAKYFEVRNAKHMRPNKKNQPTSRDELKQIIVDMILVNIIK